MQGNQGAAHATIDWRDWVAFVGYVLATAVVVSVMLASVVLVLSMQAEPLPATDPTSSPPAALTQVPTARIVAPQQAAPPASARADAQASEPAAAPAANAAPRIEITSETLRAETPIEQTLQAKAATAEAREAGSNTSAAVIEDTAGAESVPAAEPDASAPEMAARPDAPAEAR